MAEIDGDKAIGAMQDLIAEKATEVSAAITEFLNGRLTEIEESEEFESEGYDGDLSPEEFLRRSRDAACKIEKCAQYLVLMTMVIDGRADLPDGVVQNILMPMLPEGTLKNMRDFILGKLLEATDDEPPPDSIH